MPVRLYPKPPPPAKPCFDPYLGNRTIADVLCPLGVAWSWRSATPKERPGFVAAVKADPKAKPPIKASPAVIPPDDWYALDLHDWTPDDEQLAKIDAAVAAWNPAGSPP